MSTQPYVPAILQTISGHMVNLLDPQVEDVTLRDIAYHLSRIPRFNGATIGRFAWSIADHSILVEDLMSLITDDPRWRLAALLHDAHEFVVGDITRPMQSARCYVSARHVRPPRVERPSDRTLVNNAPFHTTNPEGRRPDAVRAALAQVET
jgi:hypothetical protein